MQTNNGSDRRLMSVPETAHWLGVSERHVYSLLASGDLKSVKIGRRRLVDIRDAEKFVESRREVS